MIAQAKALVSADDYFILDQQSHSKLEYYAGTIVAQAGSTARHNLILTNVIGHLYPQVRLHGCHTVSYTHLDVYKRQPVTRSLKPHVVCASSKLFLITGRARRRLSRDAAHSGDLPKQA